MDFFISHLHQSLVLPVDWKVRGLEHDPEQRLHRLLCQLVDVERPRRGAGARGQTQA